jgi:hypothetical protein
LDAYWNGVRRVGAQKNRQSCELPAFKSDLGTALLDVGLGFAQTGNTVALFPLAALLEYGYAFKTLENVTFDDDAGGALETFVL